MPLSPALLKIISVLSKIEHGFTHEQAEAQRLFQTAPPEECFAIARELLGHKVYQARMLGAFLLGHCAPGLPEALMILRDEVSADSDWRVQEILAKAFDCFCSQTGYEKALPVIREWISDERPNICRAVTEGLRIWTGRPYFREHPEEALALISRNKASHSEYLRKSVGNAIKDIGRKHPEAVGKMLAAWDLGDKRVAFTHKYASKPLKKRGNKE